MGLGQSSKNENSGLQMQNILTQIERDLLEFDTSSIEWYKLTTIYKTIADTA